MGTLLIGMTLKEACDAVKDYADMHTGGDLLAGIKDMEACYDDLDREDRTAYNMFIKAGQEMFMADE
jgi:hypothetical protein